MEHSVAYESNLKFCPCRRILPCYEWYNMTGPDTRIRFALYILVCMPWFALVYGMLRDIASIIAYDVRLNA